MTRSFNFVTGMWPLIAICLCGLLNAQTQQTPFSFVLRDDVGEELSVSQSQLVRVDQLQVHCEALCRQRMREAISSMDPDLQQQFDQLDSDQQQTALAALERDMREVVQLEALDQQVLNDSQMERFNQLWTQLKGLDSLTFGISSRQLGMSNIQISQIQALRNDSAGAMDACVQNSELSRQQQFVQIQNIQINLIDNCLDVLSEEQIQQFANMCGEPFELDPVAVDPTTDNNENANADSIVRNLDAITAVDKVPGVASQIGTAQATDNQNSDRATDRNPTGTRH